MERSPDPPAYSLRGLLAYFLKLGTVGFGGPIALVAAMQRDLVEKRSWITREEYVRGMALAQLAPGPLAAQLAMYLGFVRGGVAGATLAGVAFVLPSFLMVVLLGMLYVAYGGLPWMQSLFYGIGAAVIGIILKSAGKLAAAVLKKEKILWFIASAMGVVTAWTQREIAWLFFLSGFAAMFFLAPSRFPFSRTHAFAPLAALAMIQPPEGSTAAVIFLYFAKAGAFVFGSGLAIVPFLYGGAVEQYHWLDQRQFLDAIAVAMITPGPVIITVGFIGYLADGMAGAAAAALGVFLPVYLVVLFLAPFYERLVRHPQVRAFVDGVTAAATGAIAGAVVVMGRRAVTDLPTALIAAGALYLLLRFKLPEPLIVAAAGLCGAIIFAVRR